MCSDARTLSTGSYELARQTGSICKRGFATSTLNNRARGQVDVGLRGWRSWHRPSLVHRDGCRSPSDGQGFQAVERHFSNLGATELVRLELEHGDGSVTDAEFELDPGIGRRLVSWLGPRHSESLVDRHGEEHDTSTPDSQAIPDSYRLSSSGGGMTW